MRLLLLLILVSAARHLSLAQVCPAQETPSDALGPFYQENSPLGSSAAPASELSNPLLRLEVTGRVLSSTDDCHLGIANVTVEVWYAGGSSANGMTASYTDEHRGQVTTSECGQYSFVQSFPAFYPSRPILHDHFRLSRNGQELLVTQMYFLGEGEGYVADTDTSRKMQVTQVAQNQEGVRSVEFNMYVDVEGDSECQVDVDSSGTESVSNGATTTSNTTSSGSARLNFLTWLFMMLSSVAVNQAFTR